MSSTKPNRSRKNDSRKYSGDKAAFKNQDKNRWRKVAEWFLPIVSASLLALLVTEGHARIYTALVSALAMLVGAWVLLERHIWKEKQRQQRKYLRITCVLLCVAVVALAFVWIRRTWIKVTPPFSVKVAVEAGSDKRGARSGVFWATYKTKFGDTISPAQLGLYIELINFQTVPATISSYTVEARNLRNEWVKLIRVNVGMGELFFCIEGCDLRHARRMDTKNSLDYLLQDKTVAPYEPVRGWAFFELPENIQPTTPYRIHVEDMLGKEVTQVSADSLPIGPVTDNVQYADIHILTGERDISGYYFRYFSDPSPMW